MDIRAPEEQTEGTRSQVLRWLKNVGDSVAEHEPLIEIETDKVTVEVAAPASGVLREILKGEQEEIAPGEVLGRLETALRGEDSGRAGESADARSTPPMAREEAQSSRSAADSSAAQSRTDSASNSAAGLNPAGLNPAAGSNTAAGSNLAANSNFAAGSNSTADSKAAHGAGARTLSPAVARLLAERGLDASAIRGSGDGGRITVDDVLAHSAGSEPRAHTPRANDTSLEAARHASKESMPLEAARRARSEPSAGTPASHPSPSTALPSHTVPHAAIRKRIAAHMVESLLQTAPHVTTVFEADMSAVIAHRAANRATLEAAGASLTFTAYFLSAAAAAIRAVPEANSRWTDSALEIYDVINVGVATAIEGTGLVVPVLRDVGLKDVSTLARELHELVAAARGGKLQPADVRGGTFTISNHGVSGSLFASPIVINQPQSAILGIGKLEKRVTIGDEDQVIVRPKCYVTLTIDHRVMDGHQANRFLQVFVNELETWPAR